MSLTRFDWIPIADHFRHLGETYTKIDSEVGENAIGEYEEFNPDTLVEWTSDFTEELFILDDLDLL